MRLSSAVWVVAATQFGRVVAQLSVVSGSFSVLNSVGISTASSEFSSASPSPLAPASLSDGDVLKLAFVVHDGDAPVQPHQAMVSWVPTHPVPGSKAKQDWLSTVKVRKGGKGRWELDITRAPSALLSLPSPLTLTLLIGHFSAPQALAIPLGTFSFAPKLVSSLPEEAAPPARWETERYGLMPEIHWTHRAKEQTVNSAIAFAGLLFVLAPWLLYLAIIAHLAIPISIAAPSSLVFLGSISAFEALLGIYWLSNTMKLIPTLPYFFGLAGLTAFSGRRALGVLKRKREGKQAKSE